MLGSKSITRPSISFAALIQTVFSFTSLNKYTLSRGRINSSTTNVTSSPFSALAAASSFIKP
jgi:hypothetical protein